MGDTTNDGLYVTHQELVNQFGVVTPAQKSHITGLNSKRVSTSHIYCSGSATILGPFSAPINSTKGIVLSQGDLLNPSLSFAGDLDTGLFSSGPGNISFATNGTKSFGVDNTAVTFNKPITTDSGDLVFNPAGDNIDFSGKTLINAGGISVHVGSPNQVIINDNSGNLTGENQLATTRGGTNLNTSASTGIAQVNGGVWSISPLSHNIINVTKTSPAVGQFTSIAAAIASISGASSSNPFLIIVQPGVYIEGAMTVPSWVRIQGSGGQTTAIVPNSNSITLFTMQSNSFLTDMTLQGLGGTGTAIRYDSVLNSNLVQISIINFPTGVYARASTGLTNLIFTNVIFNAPLTNAIVVDGTALSSSFAVNVIINASLINGNGASVIGALCQGPFASLNLSTSRISGLTSGTGLQIQDGAQFTSQGSQIIGCNNGVLVANIGSGPTIAFANIAVLNCISSGVNVANPGTTGVLSCMVDRTKLSIDPSSTVAVFFTDPVASATGIVGDLLYSRFTGGVLTEHGDLLSDCSSLGTYNGGSLSAGVGLQINVSAGVGYVTNAQVYPNQQLIKLSWLNSTLALPANSVNYIYISNNGVLSYAGALTDTFTTLVLGRVGTTAIGIEFIDPQEFSNYHPVNENLTALRNILGARVTAGCIVSPAGLQLNITTGTYYFNNNAIGTIGGMGVSFYAYYHNSPTTYTRTLQSAVDNANYDSGSGLSAIPAGQYVKHTIYTVGTGAAEQYFLVYGQALFASSSAAIAGNVPTPPNYFTEGIVLLAAIIVQQGNGTIVSVLDLRPIINGPIASSTGAIYHSALLGLLADDHTQYLLVDGTRAMNGNLSMGSNNITSIGTLNGVLIESHASRHLPNGLDPLTTAAPLTTLTTSTLNTVGTANSFARSDHSHAIDQTTFSLNSLSGILGVAKGGTGATTFTSGNFLQGNGTGAVTATKVVPTGVVVGTTDSQTLTNKTLTSPVISTIVNSGTLTLPTATDTLVGRATSDTLTNKNLVDNTTFIVNSVDISKVAHIDLSGATTGTGTTFVLNQTANRVITFPDATDTLVGRGTTDTLTNKTLTAPVISTITNGGTLTLPTGTDTLVGRATTDTLTNKNLVDNTTFIIDNSVATRRLNFNVAGSSNTTTTLATSQTSNVTLTLPNISDTLITRDSVDSLTNKLIESSANYISVNNVEISTLLNQSVTTTSSPTFNSINLTGSSLGLNQFVHLNSWSISAGTSVPFSVLSIPIPTNTAVLVETRTVGRDTTDGVSTGVIKRTARATNTAGVVTVNGTLELLSNMDPAGFVNDSLLYVANGSNVDVYYGGTDGRTHIVCGTTWVYSMF